MGLILFQTDDELKRESFESAPVIWEGHESVFLESPAAVSIETSIPSIEASPWTTDFRFFESAPDAKEVHDRTSSKNPRHTFLVHNAFSNIQCLYGSEYPGGSAEAGSPYLLQEADGSRLFSPLKNITDKYGKSSKCASLTNSPNCLFATTPDNSKVIIVDPYSDMVKVINSTGDTVYKYSMPCGTFAKCIALTASNDRYWLLLWESADPPTGNRFRLEARRFDDSSLFEYEIIDGFLESVPEITPGFLFAEGFEAAPVTVITPEELALFESAPSVTDYSFFESAPTVKEAVFFMSAAPVVEDIRVELRMSAPRMAEHQTIKRHPEINRLEQLFDAETDVFRPGITTIPIRTENQKHEKPYQEVKPHYYGHPDHYEFAEESGFPLVDQFFETSSGKIEEWSIPPFPENTRAVTAPHFAATETRLIFGTVIHRGGFPWRDGRYATDDRRHRSSQTLLQHIDLDTRKVKNDASQKIVNMSGAGAFQASDTLGLVMVDSFWEMGTDDLLEGYFAKTNRQFKQTDIVRFDFNFDQQAVSEKNDWEVYEWSSAIFGQGPYSTFTAQYLYEYYSPTDYTTSYIGHSTSRTDLFFSQVPYNCCLRLSGDLIIWAGQSFRGVLNSAHVATVNENNATDIHAIKELDQDLLTLNTLFVGGAPKALLAVDYGYSHGWIESRPTIVPADSWTFIEAAPVVVNIYSEVIDSSPVVVTDFQFEAAPEFYESGLFLEAAPVIANQGYRDSLEIITNTSPNEGMDLVRANGSTTNATNDLISHPNQQMGVYPYSARFWRRDAGLLDDGGAGETWRVTFLKNIEADLIDRSDSYLDNKYKLQDREQYRYLAFPYPVQYISDNANEVLFGLFRPAEGKSWSGRTNVFKQTDGSYVDDVGVEGAVVDCGNTPIGGVLHKYESPNTPPVKTVYIPGYIQKDTISEYDPFFQIRYFGHSPTDKRLYVVRAFGRRDYWGQGSGSVENYDDPFARGGDDGIDFKMESINLPAIPTPGVPYLPEAGQITTLGAVYGGYPSADNVPVLDYTDSSVVYSTIKKTMTLSNFSTAYQDQIVAADPNHYKFDLDQSIDWDESANTYEERDVIVYNYDLELIDRVVSINGIGSDETILHLTERGGTYFILTQVHEDEPFNWAKYHSELATGQPVKSNFEDTQYGYGSRKMRIYSVEYTIYGAAELVAELPWAGHSVGDTLIQEITDTHVWLNWSGTHKGRSGSCLGVGVKRDGTGYVEMPGLISIHEDELAPSGWTLLCYRNTSKGSAYHFVNNENKFDPGITRRYVSGFTAEKFPRWGDGEISKLVKIDESSLQLLGEDSVYHPPEDWYRPILEGEDNYWNDDHQSFFGEDFYPGGSQPAYSQFIKRKYYNFIEAAPVVTESVESSTPSTWFKVTNGGPAIL